MREFVEAYRKMQEPPAIVESTLSPRQKDMVDSSYYSDSMSPAYEKISSVLGDKRFHTFPLTGSHGTEVDPDVSEHLRNHGYDIDDYQKGIAAKKVTVGNPAMGIPHREKVIKQSIGSILEKTKAEPHVIKAFQHDPARTSTKTSGHHVCITQTPYGVAAMSTGTNWTSCMNLNGGQYNHHLEDDIREGTHVAYLVHHDDEDAFKHGEPSKPIGRVALKPFHNEDDSDDVIFRPEAVSYGNATSEFHNAVSQWAVHNYPAKSGVTYKKNDSVYDDDGNSEYHAHGSEEIKDSLNGNYPIVERSGNMVDHHAIDGAIKHLKENLPSKVPNSTINVSKAIEHISQIGNLSPNHVGELANISKNETDNHSNNMWSLAVHHGDKFSTKMHQEVISSGKNPTRKMISGSKFPEEAIDKLDVESLPMVRRSKIKDHHVEKVIDHRVNRGNGSAYILRDMAHFLKQKHIDKLVSAGIDDIPVIKSEHFTKEHHDTLMSRNTRHADLLKFSKHATLEDHDAHPSMTGFSSLMANQNVSETEAKKIGDRLIGQNVSRSSVHVPEHIGKHLDYSKIADSKTPINSFLNKEHSWKHLDALEEKAKKSAEKHEIHGTEESYDEHMNDVGDYHDALIRHFENHSYDEDSGRIIDESDFDKVEDKVHDGYHGHLFDNGTDTFYDSKKRIERINKYR
jgi:hypothetical protein